MSSTLVHENMATGDDNGDIEAIVMKNLSYTSSTPEKDIELSSFEQSRKRLLKRSRRISQRANVTPAPSSDTGALTESLADAAKHVEERALRLALIHSQRDRKEKPISPKRPSTGAAVFQAPDIEEHAPRRRSRSRHEQNNGNASKDADAAELVEEYRREVGRFGSSALHKRDRKMYETAELVKLGCRKPKNEKMPIGILTKKRRYQKIRERKKKEMDLATGMLVRTTRK